MITYQVIESWAATSDLPGLTVHLRQSGEDKHVRE